MRPIIPRRLTHETELMPDEIRLLMIEAGIILVAKGQSDFTRGHVSMRMPGQQNHILMKPHSYGLEEMDMDNIVTVDLEGNKLGGTGRLHSELPIHTKIYEARADVQSVLHTHPEDAVALSSLKQPLQCFSQGGALFHDQVGLYTDTIDLIRKPEQGEGVAKALGDKRAVLLKNHGLVVTARSIPELVISAIALVEAIKIELKVRGAGEAAEQAPIEQILALQEKLSRPQQFWENFNYLARVHVDPIRQARGIPPRDTSPTP